MADADTMAETGSEKPEARAALGSAVTAGKKSSGRERFPFVDQFRGVVGVMMALGHSSGFFNSAWKTLSMFDPFFSVHGQFWLRYMGYLCAPGFLMMNGTVAWYSYTRRVAAGHSEWAAKWHLIQRGLFLILVQVTWVNLAWVGFRLEKYRIDHIGIIATIGISMILLSLIVNTKWYFRLAVAVVVWVGHQLMLGIPYDPAIFWQKVVFETFIQAGDWNKYPVLPWLGLGVMGSVMATGWLEAWKDPKRRITWTFVIGFAALLVAAGIRLGRGFGNIEIFDQFPHYSFFLERKYPPSLFHNLWFFGAVSVSMGAVQVVSHIFPPLVRWLGTIGKVPLFFYCMHISILSIVADRLGVYYRQGGVGASLVGWVGLLLVMWPLSRWFGGVKARSKNRIIQMI